MSKTLFISDLDGTLLNSSAELSKYTANALNTLIDNGLDLSIATARTLASSGKILADVKLNIPIVLMNGVLIYDVIQKRYIKINKLAIEAVATVIDILRTFDTTGFMYKLDDSELTTYYESLERKPLRDFVEERMTRYNKIFKQTDHFDDVSTDNIIYFTLLNTQEKLLPVHNALSSVTNLSTDMYKDNYSLDLWYLEVHSEKASKQNAVNYLREAYGYERVICFGDNLNDLPMFAASDVKVAVENAKQEVRAAADYICGTNDTDGVVKWLMSDQIL